MKHGWTYKKFEDCLEKVVYTSKILSKDYLEEGAFPIVSQEEELISGYWNNDKDLFHIIKPVVVFGDHTRVLKYIDFNFVLGADGVKILQPTDDIKAKFLYYYLKWFDVPSLGYSRHYKLLKECLVPAPPLPVQHQICSLLDKLSRVIEAKKEQLKELDNLAQAIFYDMFGDPTVNDKGWVIKPFNTLCSNMTKGPFGSDIKKKLFVPKSSDTYKVYIQVNAIQKDENLGDYYISKDYFDNKISRFEVKPRDYIITCDGTLGKYIRLSESMERGIISASLLRITLNDSISYRYFESLWDNYILYKLKSQARNAALIHLPSAKKIGEELVPVPPLPLQQSFAEKVEAIERQKELINQSIREVQTLFDSRMDYWFSD